MFGRECHKRRLRNGWRRRNEERPRRAAAAESLEQRTLLSVSAASLLAPRGVAGNSWTYLVTTSQGKSANLTQTVIGPVTFNGTPTTEIDTTNSLNSNISQDYFGFDSAGDYVNYGSVSGAGGADTQTDVYAPYRVGFVGSMVGGDTYNFTNTDTTTQTIGGVTSTDPPTNEDHQLTLLSETLAPVTVPAGTFDAYQGHEVQTTTIQNPDGTTTMTTGSTNVWYAPGVGIVKVASSDGVTDVLTQYKVAGATLTWTGAGDGVSWSDPKNWDKNMAPSNTDSLVFPAGSPLTSNNDLAALSISTIDIQGSGYDLTGNSISLTTGLTSEAGNNTYDIDTTLVGSPSLDDQTGDLTVAAVLSGDSLTVSGGGIVTLDQSDTYTGTTTLSAGITVDDSALTDAFGNGQLTIGAGAQPVTLADTAGGADTLDNDITLDDGSTLAADPTVILGGTITVKGKNALAPVGPNDQLTLNGATITGTGTLTVSGSGKVLIQGKVASTVQLAVASGELDLGATLQNAANQVTVQGGVLQLLSSAAGSGGIDVQSGTLKSSDSGPAGYSGTVTLESGGTLNWISSFVAAGIGSGTLDLKGGTLSNGLGSLSKTAAFINNPVTLEGSVQVDTSASGVVFEGVTTVSAPSTVNMFSSNPSPGILQYAASSTLMGGDDVTFGGGTNSSLQFLGTIQAPVAVNNPAPAKAPDLLSGTLSSDGSVTVDGSQTTVGMDKGLSGSGGIDVQSGTLESSDSGPAGYSGTVTLESGGTLNWISSFVAAGIGSGTLDLKGGTLSNGLGSLSKTAAFINNPVTLEGSVQVNTSASGVVFEGVTTVSAPSTVMLGGNGPATNALVYDTSSTLRGLSSVTFIASGGGGPYAPLQLLGAIRTAVTVANTTSPSSPDILGGLISPVGSVTLSNAQTTMVLAASGLNGAGPIQVTAGTLNTSSSGQASYSGTVTADAGGIINVYDTVDSNGLGTGPVDLTQGGTLQNSSNANTILANPFDIQGNGVITSLVGQLQITQALNVETGGTLTLNGTVILSGPLTGKGSIVLGGGAFEVSSSNPGFSGDVVVDSGTIEVTQNDALGTGPLEENLVAQGVLESVASIDPVLDNPLVVHGGSLMLEGQLTFPNGITVDPGATLDIQGAGSSVVDSGPLSGGGAIIIAAGNFSATGANSSFTGAVQFQGGRITPDIAVTDAGGSFDGSPFPATVLLSAPGAPSGPSLGGVSATLTYYVGATATGMGSTTAPTNPGIYTVVGSFAGSTNYTAIQSIPVAFAISSASSPRLLATTFGDGVTAGALTNTTQRSEVRDIAVKFSAAVTLAAGAFTLAIYPGTNTSGTSADASAALGTATTPDGGITWIIPILPNTPSSDKTGSLSDGIYVLAAHAARVTDSSGNGLSGGDQTTTFHRLYGDIDGNKTVNSADYFKFKAAFGSIAGQANFNSNFDFDGNGKINSSDYFKFKANFGRKFVY